MTRSPWARRCLGAYCALVFLFLLLPLLIVFPISFSSGSFLRFPPPGYSWRWFAAFFGDPSWMRAALLSLQVAVATALLSGLLGIPLSFYLARGRSPWLTRLVDRVAVSPMIIPPVVTAIVVYSLMSSLRWIGSWQGLAVAHTILALPLVVIVVTAGLRQFDITLEQAACGLGASHGRALWHVTFPMLRPSIVSALFFAFMTSFDDLIIALFLSGANMTLPKKMFENIGYALDPTIAAVCVLQIVALLVLGGVWYAVARRLGAPVPGLAERS